MPSPAISLRIRKLRRRFGVSAPRLVVRQHVSWPLVAGSLILLVGFALVALWLVVDRNQVGALGRELDVLRGKVQSQADELAVLRSSAGTEKSIVNIEMAARQSLAVRLKGLEEENAILKEEVRLFERLILSSGEEASVRVESFRVISDGEGGYRYRLILAFRPGGRMVDFRGRLQFYVKFERDGRSHVLLLPEKKETSSAYSLEFKALLRREGGLEIPPGAVVKAVEVRILQGDTLKVARIAQL